AQLDTHRSDRSSCMELNCRHEDDRDHSKMFDTWCYETDQPFSLEPVRQAASRLPAEIYRAKGVIFTTDVPDRRAVLQVVGRRVDIALQDEWGDRPRRTHIIAIGAPGAIDDDAFRARFQQCASPSGTHSYFASEDR
ncbi:MAG TPA: GTP-binding protein, partial [Candidatus Binatia bacterium]|nr:GTP-binding protein [Candidatus Binatia bacterium]